MAFQENLRKYRELAGYASAKDFAAALDISYPTYMSYENKGREPKYELLIEISKKLGVSTDKLLGVEFDEFEYCKKMVEKSGFSISQHPESPYLNIQGVDMDVYIFPTEVKSCLNKVKRITSHMESYIFAQEFLNTLKTYALELSTTYASELFEAEERLKKSPQSNPNLSEYRSRYEKAQLVLENLIRSDPNGSTNDQNL